MEPLTQVQIGIDKRDSGTIEARSVVYLRFAFWFVAGLTGFLQIWLTDRVIWADSLSYLDSGDMLWQGDFTNAITNHWSPGLPFLLGLALKILHPVGLWEVAVVKMVDFIILLFAISCFDFFIGRFCRYHEISSKSAYAGTSLEVPKFAIAAVGYLLFLWTITHLLPAWYTTPDMLVMGILFCVCGLLLNIRMNATGMMPFAMLGIVLGCGYLVKAPMFPLAFMFIGIAFLLVGNVRKAVPRALLTFALFAIIAAPLVFRLSMLAGGLTFGKSGAWNYARFVNGISIPYHWQGQPEGSGKPVHPTRMLFHNPTVFEFGSPVRGTFPPWRDPYYWFDGITPHFDPAGQWSVIKTNAKILIEEASWFERSFIYGFLVLLCMSSDRRLLGRIVMKQWFLLLPAIAALAMYSLVLVQDRYIAPFPIIIGLVAFSAVALVRSAASLKLVYVTTLLGAAFVAASSAKPAAGELVSFAKSLHKNQVLGRDGPWHASTQAVTDALQARGLKSGDRVAYIGKSHDFYWARLAGVQVNAEIREWDAHLPGSEQSVDEYWASSSELKQQIDGVLKKAGSKAIITDALFPAVTANGWDNVPKTSFYIHMLSEPNGGAGK